MKPIDVVFQKIEVTGFDARSEEVGFRVIFSDGRPKAVARTQQIQDTSGLAEEIFREVRSKLKAIHSEYSTDDSPLSNVVLIRVKGDEELIMERMAKFFAVIREKIRNARQKKLSYTEIERQIKGLSSELI